MFWTVKKKINSKIICDFYVFPFNTYFKQFDEFPQNRIPATNISIYTRVFWVLKNFSKTV